MARRRHSPQSSFDLFLDTVCNTFGGILFIAILVAVQIRQSAEAPTADHDYSPEEIVQMQERLESLFSEVDSAKLVLDTIRRTMPEPTREEDRGKVEVYAKLSEQVEILTGQKNDFLSRYLARVHYNAVLEEKFNNLEEHLERLNNDENEIEEAIRNLQMNIELNEKRVATLKKDLEDLSEKIQKKETMIADKNDPEKGGRQEVLHLPKLKTRDSSKRTVYFVLRYNRLYLAGNSNEFDKTGLPPNALGIPIPSRGREINESEKALGEMRRLIDDYPPGKTDFSFIIYSDSFDRFYMVRNLAIEKGFEYEIKPSSDDEIWAFGGRDGPSMVQ